MLHCSVQRRRLRQTGMFPRRRCVHGRKQLLLQQVCRWSLWLQTRWSNVCRIRRLLHGRLQQRRLRRIVQAERPIVHERLGMLHWCLHDKRLRHGELPIRWFNVSKLPATKLLPSVRCVYRASWLHAESELLPHLRRRWRKLASVLQPMRTHRRVDQPIALRWPELRL